MRKVSLNTILVRAKPGQRTRGWLLAGPLSLPVALGRGGIRANKREGDGGTPRGTFRLRRVWWRADRVARPRTQLPVRRIRGDDGWCEDPRDRHYNQPIRLEPVVEATSILLDEIRSRGLHATVVGELIR